MAATSYLAPVTLLRFVVVEVLVRSLPLQRVASLLGASMEPREPGASELSAADRERIRVARAIGRRWPFGRGPCLRESLVIAWFLHRHQPVLRIGVRRAGNDVIAHAWVDVVGEHIGAAAGYHPLGATGGAAG